MNYIDPKLTAYCENMSSPETPYLKEVFRQTHLTQINPRMLSGHLQGGFLKMIVRIFRPQHVLEIGTYTGYSAIAMAEGLDLTGHIHSIEKDIELKNTISQNIKQAGFESRVTLHIGKALDVLPDLLKSIAFDMVFIDADKENYPAYLNLLKNGLKPGALILADNVLWSGKVLDETALNTDKETMAIDQFNRDLRHDNSFETVMLPLRDGISMAIKK